MQAILLERLRDLNPAPRVHGNGFVQLIGESVGSRYHIWHPKLPRQKVPTPIHNHRFGFISTVLLGRLVNITYALSANTGPDSSLCPDRYQRHAVINTGGDDSRLQPTNIFCSVHVEHARLLRHGEFYNMSPTTFHETVPLDNGIAVTHLMKTTVFKEFTPEVLVPAEAEPDNDFSRLSGDPKELWDIILPVMTSAKMFTF